MEEEQGDERVEMGWKESRQPECVSKIEQIRPRDVLCDATPEPTGWESCLACERPGFPCNVVLVQSAVMNQCSIYLNCTRVC